MYRFCRIGTTNLICYRNGTILRFDKRMKKWTVCVGSKDKDGYLRIGIDGKDYRQHRVIAHAFDILDIHSQFQIDHRDRNSSNNCIFNLRAVTSQQNNFNRGAKGYSWNKKECKFKSCIKYNFKNIHLGYFDKEEDARKAYLDAKKIYHII